MLLGLCRAIYEHSLELLPKRSVVACVVQIHLTSQKYDREERERGKKREPVLLLS